jgi:hypothetical protein
MIDRTNTDVMESETDTGHSEPKEDIEEKPKPIIFRMRQEPRYVSMKLIRKKQYQMRRV